VAATAAPAATPAVAVITGPDAPELEKFAAAELCGYLGKLFGLEVKPTTSLSPSGRDVFLIGNPTTNPLIKKGEFSSVTEQGIVVKSIRVGGRSALIVGGGSPKAT